MTHAPAFVSSTVLKLCTGSPSVAGFGTDAAGVLWGPALWTDDTAPRTDRPVRFVEKWHRIGFGGDSFYRVTLITR